MTDFGSRNSEKDILHHMCLNRTNTDRIKIMHEFDIDVKDCKVELLIDGVSMSDDFNILNEFVEYVVQYHTDELERKKDQIDKLIENKATELVRDKMHDVYEIFNNIENLTEDILNGSYTWEK